MGAGGEEGDMGGRRVWMEGEAVWVLGHESVPPQPPPRHVQGCQSEPSRASASALTAPACSPSLGHRDRVKHKGRGVSPGRVVGRPLGERCTSPGSHRKARAGTGVPAPRAGRGSEETRSWGTWGKRWPEASSLGASGLSCRPGTALESCSPANHVTQAAHLDHRRARPLISLPCDSLQPPWAWLAGGGADGPPGGPSAWRGSNSIYLC